MHKHVEICLAQSEAGTYVNYKTIDRNAYSMFNLHHKVLGENQVKDTLEEDCIGANAIC